jgi:hypothetical protein
LVIGLIPKGPHVSLICTKIGSYLSPRAPTEGARPKAQPA